MKAPRDPSSTEEGGSEEACLDAALGYLARRPRSEAEIRRRLRQRGFNSEHIEKALSQLREKGFTDDASFARLWAENRESFSPRSRALLQRELRAKGIDADTIAEAVLDIDEDSSAYRAAKKKARTISLSDYRSFQSKLLSFLRRRGFDYGVCRRTANRVWEEQSKGDRNAE